MNELTSYLQSNFGVVLIVLAVALAIFLFVRVAQNKNSRVFYQWADLILTLLTAAIAFFGFKNKELAEFVALSGVLILAARYAFNAVVVELFDRELKTATAPLTKKIDELVNDMHGIKSSLDFQAVDDLRKLNDAYMHITEDLFLDAKKSVLDDATRALNKLALDKRADDLNTTDYYKTLFRALDSATAESKIYGISFFRSFEWDDSAQERTFIRKQVEAAARGAVTERVFILADGAKIGDLMRNPAIALHAKEEANSIYGYTVHEKRIPAAVRKGLGNGFIIISNKAILFDSENEADPTELVGSVCTDRSVIEKHISIFRNLDPIRTEFSNPNATGHKRPK